MPKTSLLASLCPLQLLIPMAYQVLQNAGPLPARRCPADPFPFGAWPVPADVVAMVIPAELSAGELLIGTASSPGAAGPAGSPDPVPGRDMAMGWPGTAGDVQGETWPAPAAGQSGSGTKGGSGRAAARWPTPANRIPCRSAGGYRELTRCCRACRQSGSGTRERRGHGLRLDGAGRPATSRACLAIPCNS